MLGILCGLSSEAKIAQKIVGARIACSAAVPQKARALAQDLVKQGVTRLMSFGVAGALDASLPVGALVVGEKVASPKGTWICDATWANELVKLMPYAKAGDVWGSETLVPTASEKLALNKSTGCVIVDMESQCAAEVAAEAGLPLAVARVVCDEANHNVPMLVMAAISSDGSTNIKNVLTGLLRNPLQMYDLIKVGQSMAKSLRVLDEAANAIQSSAQS